MTDSKLINANVIISSDSPEGDELMFWSLHPDPEIGLPRSEVMGREFQHSFGAAWLSVQAGFLDEGTGPVSQPRAVRRHGEAGLDLHFDACPALQNTRN